MYFITKRTSKTGKKFQKLSDKFNACFESQKALADKYGFTYWRGARWEVAGGISSVIFPEDTIVDTKIWKEVRNGEYMPRLNEGFSKSIGFDRTNDKYFGFIIDDSWTVIIIPNDCTEITVTKYRELFK